MLELPETSTGTIRTRCSLIGRSNGSHASRTAVRHEKCRQLEPVAVERMEASVELRFLLFFFSRWKHSGYTAVDAFLQVVSAPS